MKTKSLQKQNFREIINSMFNLKMFCLMKKHVYSLVMLLALVVLASTSAFAQNGTGLTPSSILLVANGSTTQFSITNGSTFAADVNWQIWDATTAEATGFTTTLATSANSTSQYNFVTSLIDGTVIDPDVEALAAAGVSNCFVKWLGTAANNVYVVQALATTDGGTCVTLRRFYVNVFNFDVQVYLCDADGSDPVSTAKSECNSWDGLVVANSTTTPAVTTLDGGEITSPHATNVNVNSGVAKYTDTYFRVDVSITGAPTGFGIEDLKWRYAMTTPSASGLSIYSVRNIIAPNSVWSLFTSESGNRYLGDDDSNTAPTGTVASMAGTVYVPAATGVADGTTTGTYVYRVRTHNNLGAADMVYDVQIDQVDLEFAGADSFNDGTKVHTSSAAAFPKLTDAADNTLTQTIMQTPASSVISVTQ